MGKSLKTKNIDLGERAPSPYRARTLRTWLHNEYPNRSTYTMLNLARLLKKRKDEWLDIRRSKAPLDRVLAEIIYSAATCRVATGPMAAMVNGPMERIRETIHIPKSWDIDSVGKQAPSWVPKRLLEEEFLLGTIEIVFSIKEINFSSKGYMVGTKYVGQAEFDKVCDEQPKGLKGTSDFKFDVSLEHVSRSGTEYWTLKLQSPVGGWMNQYKIMNGKPILTYHQIFHSYPL